MFYLVKTPWLVKKILYPSYCWEMPVNEKKLYLTFDDGPHPEITNFVLDTLSHYGAKATFFCIGKNVSDNYEVYAKIISEGHSAGNHTYSHLNGWKVNEDTYVDNIREAGLTIHSSLFRPPYGRITRLQAKQILQQLNYRIIMWSVLSGDFDTGISEDKCWNNVLKNAGAGSIIVFHDSEKAYKKMSYVLPKLLNVFSERGFSFEKL